MAVEVFKNPKDYNCHECREPCCTVKPNPAWPKSIGPRPPGIPFNKHKDLGSFRTCIKPMITPLSNELLRLYGHYRRGVFPFGKEPYGPGLYDQPAKYIRAMELISSLDH